MSRLRIPRIFFVTFAVWSATHPRAEVGAAEQAYATHSWDAFTIRYPQEGWALESLNDAEKTSTIRITHETSPRVVMTFVLFRGMPKDDPKYLANTHMTSVAAILSAAMNLSEGDDSRIFFSTGSMMVPSGNRPSARATVLTEDHQQAYHLEGCHDVHLESGHAMMVTISTRSGAGEISDDPLPPSIVAQAYEMIESVQLDVP